MDLDEWELLPRDEFNHHKTHTISNLSNTKSVIDMNYFDHRAVKYCMNENDQICKEVYDQENISQVSANKIDQNQFVDIQMDSPMPENKAVKHCINENDQICKEGCDQTNISQVSSKEMDENEFVDIQMDAPMSESKGMVHGTGSSKREEDGKEEEEEEEVKKEVGSKLKEEENSKNNGGLNNVWKWAMSGIGAVFSFAFLAASVSLVALGNRSNKENHSYNTSEVHFQIYSHHKRMKRVVKRTKRLNETMAAVRGAPYMTRAHITVGGYYDGL